MEGMVPETDLSAAVWRKSTRSGNGGNCVEVRVDESPAA
jgi:hypothetical protein